VLAFTPGAPKLVGAGVAFLPNKLDRRRIPIVRMKLSLAKWTRNIYKNIVLQVFVLGGALDLIRDGIRQNLEMILQ